MPFVRLASAEDLEQAWLMSTREKVGIEGSLTLHVRITVHRIGLAVNMPTLAEGSNFVDAPRQEIDEKEDPSAAEVDQEEAKIIPDPEKEVRAEVEAVPGRETFAIKKSVESDGIASDEILQSIGGPEEHRSTWAMCPPADLA